MSTYYVSGPLYILSPILKATLQGRDLIDRAPEALEESILRSHSPDRKCMSRISTQI